MTTLYTIGHSNHSLEDFLQLLQTYEIQLLADIRTVPRSRHVPWFNSPELKKSLKKIKIHYLHLAKLGGLRHPLKDSINVGWRNAAFRGYADYMQTTEFFAALKELNGYVKQSRTAIMCAEAVPWRCHRSLLSDAEVIRGIKVIDIISVHSTRLHSLTSFAIVDRSTRPIKIYYPQENALF
ncbi:MAG: DUF488 domain-containing protein [Proteobacteria bacterium]|nr:DUF488 domain-containing protein [Pseudomonadota bacterium]